MPKLFEELAYRETAKGLLSLRRRRHLQLGVDVLEIKLGEEHLMSDLFTVSEIALARLGLAAIQRGGSDVVVGGLGLGYTAQAVLEHDSVSGLLVVEALDAVIDWHNEGLIPLGQKLSRNRRCRFVLGDFFAMSKSVCGFDPDWPGRKFDSILVDIDHAPDRFLDGSSADFYETSGLEQLQSHLQLGGIFGLWSDDQPDEDFVSRLSAVFESAWAVPVTFTNPLQDRPFTQTVYLARKSVGH
jgi:spermidine synthase